MMHIKYFVSVFLVSILVISCQKSVDWSVVPVPRTDSTAGSGVTGGSNNGSTTGELLVKVVVELGNESLTTLYTYDAAKRLETENIKGGFAGVQADIYKKYYRGSNGRVFKVATLIKEQSIQVDTSFLHVFYANATTKNFTYTTRNITFSGMGMLDSTVYTWNATGNITSYTSYASNNIMPGMNTKRSKIDYTYNNGNLTQNKIFGELTPGGPLALLMTTNYTYDNNVNPLITDGEFILTGNSDGASKNNVTKMEFIDATNASNNSTYTTVLTYGAGKKPTSGTVTRMPENQVFKYTFFYK